MKGMSFSNSHAAVLSASANFICHGTNNCRFRVDVYMPSYIYTLVNHTLYQDSTKIVSIDPALPCTQFWHSIGIKEGS